MTGNRSTLSILASRVPKTTVPTSTSKPEVSDLSKRTVKSTAAVERSGIPKPPSSLCRRQKTSATTAPVQATGSSTVQISKGLRTIAEDESESSEEGSDSNTTLASSVSSSNEPSLYNGPQLVEPCVSNALLHVLGPCSHRVMTTQVEPCGKNCKSTDSAFANTKTAAKFACAVCISKYVQEHYAAQKSLFVPSLDKLESALGGFKPGWKAERIARMDRVWKNDAVQERKALEKLGRFCEAIPTDPDEEVLGTEVAPVKDASSQVQSNLPTRAESKTVRRRLPVSKKPKERRQAAVEEKAVVDGKRGKNGSSRIPVDPRLSKK
jgi:hypothetical protein